MHAVNQRNATMMMAMATNVL